MKTVTINVTQEHIDKGKRFDPHCCALALGLKQRFSLFCVKLPFKVALRHHFPTNNMRASESLLHSFFHDKRINGEWFALTDDDVRLILAIDRHRIK